MSVWGKRNKRVDKRRVLTWDELNDDLQPVGYSQNHLLCFYGTNHFQTFTQDDQRTSVAMVTTFVNSRYSSPF